MLAFYNGMDSFIARKIEQMESVDEAERLEGLDEFLQFVTNIDMGNCLRGASFRDSLKTACDPLYQLAADYRENPDILKKAATALAVASYPDNHRGFIDHDRVQRVAAKDLRVIFNSEKSDGVMGRIAERVSALFPQP